MNDRDPAFDPVPPNSAAIRAVRALETLRYMVGPAADEAGNSALGLIVAGRTVGFSSRAMSSDPMPPYPRPYS
jgi:hypothetical protein